MQLTGTILGLCGTGLLVLCVFTHLFGDFVFPKAATYFTTLASLLWLLLSALLMLASLILLAIHANS
jgi:hypothetical protein